MMWSPRSFQDARARMAVQDREARKKELEKAEIAELAASNKLYQEKLKEEKRVAAVKAKEVRDHERAEERAAINARKEQRRKEREARNSAKALELSQRGKTTSSKASVVKQKTMRRGVGARSHPRPITPPPARPTITTRSGRTAPKYQ